MRTIMIVMLFTSITAVGQNSLDVSSKYVKTPTGFFMVLNQGDSVLPYIEALAVREKIPSATITGLGFVNAIFGVFNKETKQYDPKTFNDVELSSMNGSIAWEQNKPSLHVHGAAVDHNFTTYGGHLLGAMVGTGSVEITVTVHQKRLQRKMDETIGAKVLQVK